MTRPPPVDRRRISRLMALAGLAIVLGLVMLAYDIYQLFQPKPVMGSPPFLCTVICGWLAYMLWAKARQLAKQADDQNGLTDVGGKEPPPDGE